MQASVFNVRQAWICLSQSRPMKPHLRHQNGQLQIAHLLLCMFGNKEILQKKLLRKGHSALRGRAELFTLLETKSYQSHPIRTINGQAGSTRWNNIKYHKRQYSHPWTIDSVQAWWMHVQSGGFEKYRFSHYNGFSLCLPCIFAKRDHFQTFFSQNSAKLFTRRGRSRKYPLRYIRLSLERDCHTSGA